MVTLNQTYWQISAKAWKTTDHRLTIFTVRHAQFVVKGQHAFYHVAPYTVSLEEEH